MNGQARDIISKIKSDSVTEYLFPGRDGNPRRDVKRFLARIKKQAELPKDFRPLHGLRHTFASLLASSGQVGMYELQKLLTHNSPQMTQRYAHLHDQALQRAANVASDIFDQVDLAK